MSTVGCLCLSLQPCANECSNLYFATSAGAVSQLSCVCVVTQVCQQKCQQKFVPPQQVQERQQESCSQPIIVDDCAVIRLYFSSLSAELSSVGLSSQFCIFGELLTFAALLYYDVLFTDMQHGCVTLVGEC